MRALLKAGLVVALSAGTALGADALKPRNFLVDTDGKYKVEQAVPEQFGDWRIDPHSGGGVVNPQQQEALNKIYNQLLSRVYVNGKGQRIMLSLAYGEDQRDDMTVHYPEVCYPAQGFQVTGKSEGQVSTPFGNIPVRRLQTQLGSGRIEPVTYWVMIGSQPTLGGIDKKLIEIRYASQGVIPDGLLFRVSSIDRDIQGAFALQEQFVRDMVAATDKRVLPRLTGLR